MPLVFCYGGNTNPTHLQKQYPSHSIVGVATLHGYQVTFRTYKRMSTECCTFTKLEESYCNVEPYISQQLQGVVVELNEAELAKMDMQECLGCIYTRKQVTVQLDTAVTLQVWLYTMIAPKAHQTPSIRYLQVVINGYTHHNIPLSQLPLISSPFPPSHPQSSSSDANDPCPHSS